MDNRLHSILKTWKRRFISFSLYFLLLSLCVILFPLFILLTVVFDGAKASISRVKKSSWPLTRAYLFFILYLSCEIGGLTISFGCWLFSGIWMGRSEALFIRMNAWLQGWWAYCLLHGAVFLFSMRLKIDNIEAVSPGPMVLLVRHSSTADTVLNAVLVAKNRNILLRYILKKELLWDPCLDVVGNRLPNVFIDRSGQQTEKELAAIRKLTENLTPSDGILIYPEGTRFDQRKFETSIQRLKKAGNDRLYETAKQMRFVLPPRSGGITTIMENSGNMDFVFCAHTGFEGASNFSRFFNGELIGNTIHVKYWRVPSIDIPKDPHKFMEWLFDQWLKIDQWVADHIPYNLA